MILFGIYIFCSPDLSNISQSYEMYMFIGGEGGGGRGEGEREEGGEQGGGRWKGQ